MVSLLLVIVGIVDLPLLMPQPQVMPSSTVQELVLVDGTRLIGVVEQVVSGVIVLRRATGDRRQVDASQVVSVHTGTSATPSSTSETRVPWRELACGIALAKEPEPHGAVSGRLLPQVLINGSFSVYLTVVSAVFTIAASRTSRSLIKVCRRKRPEARPDHESLPNAVT